MRKRSTRSNSFLIFKRMPRLGRRNPDALPSWWTRWQPTMIHTALRASADLTDIAKATGLDAGEVVDRWRRWVDVQTRLDIGGRPSVDPVEVRAIERRLGPGVVR